jgi:hypothetical protein
MNPFVSWNWLELSIVDDYTSGDCEKMMEYLSMKKKEMAKKHRNKELYTAFSPSGFTLT